MGLGKSKDYDPNKDPFKDYNLDLISYNSEKYLREHKPWLFEDENFAKLLNKREDDE
jgi:hypothetical protein